MLKLNRNLIRQCRFYCAKTLPGNKTKIFSGIQPTGDIHIGNYLGAIKQWLNLQESGEDMMLSIVDLHSITLPQNPKELAENVLNMTATLLACGIDSSKSLIYQQSEVPQHTELFWHLSCISTMARLGHLPQFREKSANLKDVPLGLFVYPVLQAADILLFKATHVPVGDDQLQHLQLCQDIARMFNNRFGETFPIPRSMILDTASSRIKNLRDASKKMSKSEPDPKSRICLTDSRDEIIKKFKKALTDLTSEVTFDVENRPAVSNLMTIHSVFSGKTVEELTIENRHLDTGKYKLVVAQCVADNIAPIRTKINQYMNERDFLIRTLKDGAERATELAERTMVEVRGKVGLDLSNLSYRKRQIL